MGKRPPLKGWIQYGFCIVVDTGFWFELGWGYTEGDDESLMTHPHDETVRDPVATEECNTAPSVLAP